jgi:hypothetical protein
MTENLILAIVVTAILVIVATLSFTVAVITWSEVQQRKCRSFHLADDVRKETIDRIRDFLWMAEVTGEQTVNIHQLRSVISGDK